MPLATCLVVLLYPYYIPISRYRSSISWSRRAITVHYDFQPQCLQGVATAVCLLLKVSAPVYDTSAVTISLCNILCSLVTILIVCDPRVRYCNERSEEHTSELQSRR